MTDRQDVAERLRDHILGHLHVRILAPGDRLRSIRQISDETGLDHRLVGDAYRILEEEGLVEIRPGSGVYVAAPERDGGGLKPGSVHWLAGVLTEAWSRRITVPQVADLVGRLARSEVRCGLVESTHDLAVAFAAELEEHFGLEVVRLKPADSGRPLAPASRDRPDLLAASTFELPTARRIARDAGLALVTLTVDHDFGREVTRLLRSGACVGVYCDDRYRERIRALLSGDLTEGLRLLSADEVDDLDSLAREGETLLATRAARERLGAEPYHLLPPPWRLLSRDAIEEMAHALVRLPERSSR